MVRVAIVDDEITILKKIQAMIMQEFDAMYDREQRIIYGD